jgi:hypothetical protein
MTQAQLANESLLLLQQRRQLFMKDIALPSQALLLLRMKI